MHKLVTVAIALVLVAPASAAHLPELPFKRIGGRTEYDGGPGGRAGLSVGVELETVRLEAWAYVPDTAWSVKIQRVVINRGAGSTVSGASGSIASGLPASS